jgi:deoxyribodipyrimidine photo-lyase
LRESGLIAESFNGSLLFEPWTILNRSGEPYRVFSAFWRACLASNLDPPRIEAPGRMLSPQRWPHSLELSELELEPKIDWASGLREVWSPGEAGARQAFQRFLRDALNPYPVDRNRPDLTGTSRLSPHLHFGEISPGQVWRAVTKQRQGGAEGCEAYLREIGWREFAYHLLHHHPESPHKPIRAEFANFSWDEDPSVFKAWKRGGTGYPLVDAGMRELWHTGWMHNRVRMVVASFLVKHLLILWQEGATWFWDTLVDADLANNTLGWQWTAGCGADAAPYFRIFNFLLQAAKFDPHGAYVRHWVPELNGGNDGSRYPSPIVDHEQARRRALAAFARI